MCVHARIICIQTSEAEGTTLLYDAQLSLRTGVTPKEGGSLGGLWGWLDSS